MAINDQRFHPCRHCHNCTSCATASNWQSPAGHTWSTICATNSSLKYLIMLSVGLGADCPKPHKLVYLTVSHRSCSSAKSSMLARPCTTRESSSYISTVPTRHGTHLPHDSDILNSMK